LGFLAASTGTGLPSSAAFALGFLLARFFLAGKLDVSFFFGAIA
jgi:hypothetical protein